MYGVLEMAYKPARKSSEIMVGVGRRGGNNQAFPILPVFPKHPDHIHIPPVLWYRQYFSLNPLSFELNTCKMLISLVLCHCHSPINSFLKSSIYLAFQIFLGSSLGTCVILFSMNMHFGIIPCIQHETIYLWIVIDRMHMVFIFCRCVSNMYDQEITGKRKQW